MIRESRLIGYTQEQIRQMQQTATAGAPPILQNARAVQNQASTQGYSQPKQLTPQFNPQEASYLSQMSNSGGVGQSDTYGNQLLGRIDGIKPKSAAEVASAFDDRIRSMQERGMSFDPVAIAQEKANAIAQFQADESLALQKMRNAQNKQANSVAIAQRAMNAKTMEGQRLQSVANIRKMHREGKISLQDMQRQIQQLYPEKVSPAPSAASPVAATAPAAGTAPPSSTGVTATALEGGTSAGTPVTGTPPREASGTDSSTPDGTEVKPITTGKTAADMALTQLPAEFQVLAPFLQQFFEQNEELQNQNRSFFEQQLATMQEGSKTIEQKMEELKSGFESSFAAMQSLMDSAKKAQDENLAKQEKAERERLLWEEGKATVELNKQKARAHESMVAQIALAGGFGQDAGLRAVRESDTEFDSKLLELQQTFNFARTDLAAKFSSLYQENTNNYVQNSLANAKELREGLVRINMQGIQNTQERQKVEMSLISSAWDAEVKLRTERADKNFAIAKEINTIINQSRDDKRAQEQLGWQRMDWAVKTYGSNVPQAILDSIGKQLPGVDVRSIANQMTLAEMKKKSGGSGGAVGGFGGPTFSISERSATGAPLTLETYIAQKEQDFHKTTAGPVSPQQRSSWEREYNAKLAEERTYSSDAIWGDWLVKQSQTGNFASVAQMEATEQNVKNALARKDYTFARRIVDEIGAKPPEKTIERISNLERLEYDLNEMMALVGEIEDKIGPFPTEGALWSWMNENIETTPQYQRMKQLRDSNLAPYSRGVSGDKGATTEADVGRAVSSLINENVSGAALKAGLQQAIRQTQISRTLYLDNMRKGGYRVNALQTTSAEPAPMMTPELKAFLDRF